MECMANSDNVIRAGLTPKLRDIPNLVSGLTYTASDPSKHAVDPKPFSSLSTEGVSTLYDPPVPEFSVVQVKLPSGRTEKHPGIDGPSVAIVTQGGGVVRWGEEESLEVGLGDVFFVGAGKAVSFKSGEEDEIVLYRAFVEVH